MSWRYRRRRGTARSRAERLAQLNAEYVAAEQTHLVRVSDPLASELRVWSLPVQVMVDLQDDGMLDLVFRSADRGDEHAGAA